MKKTGIAWLNLFLIAFPTTLFLHYAEGKTQGMVLDLLRLGKLTESLNNVLRRDPIAHLGMEPMIKHYGFPVEVHRFYSSDGYMTTLHRIPHGRSLNSTQRGGFPVLIQHGVLVSGQSWFTCDENSLPFLLADQGFDVWVSSMRGSALSLGHKTLNITNTKYWNYSLDDLATKELPAFVDYILARTGTLKLHYIGHFLGAILLFLFLSALPEYNDKIERASLLSVSGYFSRTQSPFFRIFRTVGPKAFQGAWDLLFSGGYGVPTALTLPMSVLCRLALGPLACSSTYILFTGDNVAHGNLTRLERFTRHSSHTSVKGLSQLLQWMKSARIAKFDYGQKENLKKYGSPIPPVYNLSNIRRPIQALIGPKDAIATVLDAYKTLKEIGPFFVNPETSLVPDPEFNYVDFLVHDNVYNLAYKPIINFLLTGNSK